MQHRFVLGLILLAACSSSSNNDGGGDDSPPPDSGSGGGTMATLTATWSIRHADGSPSMCDGAYTTIQVNALPWVEEFGGPSPGADAISALFDCAAGTGQLTLPTSGTSPVDEDHDLNGKYDVEWVQTDATGQIGLTVDVQTAFGDPLVADLSHGDATLAMTMYPDDGYFWIGWGLFGTKAGQRLPSCTAGGVDRIEVALTNTATQAMIRLSFPCENADYTVSGVVGVEIESVGVVGSGIAPVPAGEYNYVATAYAGSTAVGTGPMSTTTIEGGNHVDIISEKTTIDLPSR